MEKASACYGKMNCGECIIKTYNEEMGKDVPIAIGSGMGIGLGVGSVCGAVLAACVLIGIEKGRASDDETNEARKPVKEFVKAIREKHGSEICSQLKKSGVSCHDIVDSVYDEMKNYL